IYLHFVAWSAGQKEYMPLSMANYFLSETSSSQFRYIVIEEPEMGLHPRAIVEFINEISLLMNRGYKIVISTHSPVFLEFAWAIKTMQDSPEENFKKVVSEAGIANPQSIDILYQSRKKINTYFFNDGISKDISSLDAWSEDPDISQMGELTSFNARICDAIAKYKID
ncbi:MAG: ATP-binding protein, partial [Bacteroidales bacterium]|nr:ATP-binding protein [Bacteroidales bacterium]